MDALALLVFAVLTAVVVGGAIYLAMWHDEDAPDGRDGVGDEDAPRITIREELEDFASYAKTNVAKRAREAIVRVQRLTHRDDEEASWRRLSDTNPVVRWVKRTLGDDQDGLGESLIDEDDDDYEDMMTSEPDYAFSEFADYLEEASADATLDPESATRSPSVVSLPRGSPSVASYVR